MFNLSLFANVALGGVIAAAVAYYVGRWFFKLDEKIEDRRRAAGQLAIALAKVGLKRIPEFLLCYSVGDYSGMGEKLIELVRLFLSGEAAVLDEFADVFDNVLKAKLSTEEGRAFIAAKLADSAKDGDVGTIADAPKATTKKATTK
jgi:hypothetical protein